MLYDLHSHTTYSDGALSPAELIQRAQAANVDVLAITDHDTVAGILQLKNELRDELSTELNTEITNAAAPLSTDSLANSRLRLLPAVELSTQWGSIGVHIVGLNIQLDSTELHDALAKQKQARLKRAGIIAERLSKKGFPDLLPAVIKAAGRGTIGRPHFAQQLLAVDGVKSTDEAFRKYLGTGKIGDVKKVWAPLEEVVSWVRMAGGTAVLAHPDKYHLTRTKLKALVSDFKAAGGEAIEVISGHQIAYKTKNLSELCKQNDLLASCGSDFHKPGQHWAEVGKHSALPSDCRPVWDRW
ncbi:MAG: PHP domain-containing protein [Porticoccaceae bacterium]|nr:PHP domain-containing protein [Porticoccaceae bacterium]